MGIFRQVFLTLSLSILIIASAAEASTVKGKIANASNQKKVYLFVYQGDRILPNDSITFKNGSFSFKSKSDAFPQGMYKIGFNPENSSTLILGKEDLVVELDAKAWDKPAAKNSPENAAYGQFREINNALEYQMRILDQKYQNLSPMAQSNPQGFQQAVMKLRQNVDSLMKDQQQKLLALKQKNTGTYMAKVLDLTLSDASQTAENFITSAQLEDPELQRTNLWEARFATYVQRFGENDPDKWVILADQIVNQFKEKTIAREIAFRSASKALLVLEQNGVNAGYDLAKKYKQEFPGKESERFLSQFTPGPPTVGEMAPDIQLADKDGKILPLSSMKGKVVLLDFWASWCGPCRHENPNVVRAYNQYKDKGFTVFSVSLDQSKDKWLAAIAKDGLAWENHVSDLKGWGSAGAALYQVRGIPATFLLDKEGKIIAKNLRGSALDDKLKELLGP